MQLGYLKKLVPEVFEALQAVGINAPGEEPIYIKHPCSGVETANGDWSNLYQHSLLVGDKAARLFTALQARGYAGEGDVADAARLGCLHDRNRRYQRLIEQERRSCAAENRPFQAPCIDDLVKIGIPHKIACYINDKSPADPQGFDNRSGGENAYKFFRIDGQGQVHSVVLDLLIKLKSAAPEQSVRSILSLAENRDTLLHSAVVMLDNFTLSCRPDIHYVTKEGVEHHLLSSYDRILGSQQFAWYPLAWTEGYYLQNQEIKYFRPADHAGGQLPADGIWLGNISGIQVALTQQIAELFKHLISPDSKQSAESFMLEFLRAI